MPGQCATTAAIILSATFSRTPKEGKVIAHLEVGDHSCFSIGGVFFSPLAEKLQEMGAQVMQFLFLLSVRTVFTLLLTVW